MTVDESHINQQAQRIHYNNKTKSIQYKVINLKEQKKKTVWIAFNGMQLYIIFWTRKHMIKNRQYT